MRSHLAFYRLFAALFFAEISIASLASGYWSRFYGTPGVEHLFGAEKTADGGFILLGQYQSDYYGDKDLTLLKLDPLGHIEWQRRFFTADTEEPAGVCELPSGGYVVACNQVSQSAPSDFFLAWLEPDGDTTIVKAYETADKITLRFFEFARDGSFFLVGSSGSDNNWLARLDASGEIRWQRALNLSSEPYDIEDAAPTGDGGLIVAASFKADPGYTGDKVAAVKVSGSGTIEWSKSYGRLRGAGDVRLSLLPDGTIGLAASAYIDALSAWGLWFASLGIGGDIQWQKGIAGFSRYEEAGIAICAASSGGWAAAFQGMDDDNDWNAAVRISRSGEILWSSRLDFPREPWVKNIMEVPGGDIVMAGDAYMAYQSTSEIYLQKIDSSGHIPSYCKGGRDFSADSATTNCSSQTLQAMVSPGDMLREKTFSVSWEESSNCEYTYCESAPTCTMLVDVSVPATVVPLAGVTFAAGVSTSPGCEGETSYEWEFGDGTPASDAQVAVHSYASPGDYSWHFNAVTGENSYETSGIILVTSAPAESNTWATQYMGMAYDFGRLLDEGAEGYTCMARSSYYGFGEGDSILCRLGRDGTERWQRRYSAEANLSLRAIEKLAGGGYIAAGSASPHEDFPYELPQDFVVLKLDDEGNPLWARNYGGNDAEESFDICQSRDGGYFVAGYSMSFGAGRKDAWVLKLDGAGDIAWQKTLGGSREDWASSVLETSDGGCLVAGTTGTDTGYTGFLARFSAGGDLVWQAVLAPAQISLFRAIGSADGGIFVSGNVPSGDVWLMKVRADGSQAWMRIFRYEGKQEMVSLFETVDGNLSAAATSEMQNSWEKAGLVFLVGDSGQLIWGKRYDIPYLTASCPSSDGGLLLSGSGNTAASSDYALIMKLDAEGYDPACTFYVDVIDGDVAEGDFKLEPSQLQVGDTRIPSAALGVNVDEPIYDFSLRCSGASPLCRFQTAVSVPPEVAVGGQAAFVADARPIDCGPAGASYAWDFGDGSRKDSNSLTTHSYASVGSYRWSMEIEFTGALPAHYTGVIEVKPPPAPRPEITGVSKAGSPFKLKVAGQNFHKDCTIRIDGIAVPKTIWKNSNSLVASGGSALKAMVPKNKQVLVTVVNNDDGAVSKPFAYTRQ